MHYHLEDDDKGEKNYFRNMHKQPYTANLWTLYNIVSHTLRIKLNYLLIEISNVKIEIKTKPIYFNNHSKQILA